MPVDGPNDDIIREFVRGNAGDCAALIPLAGDASMRRYYRAYAPGGPVMVCYDETISLSADGEHQFLVVHSLLERYGVPVPRVLALDRARGLLLLEDLGDTLVEESFPSLPADEAEALYGAILDILARLQSIPPDGSPVPFGRSFDMEKLMFEFDFFIEHAVKNYFGFSAPASFFSELSAEFLGVAGALQRPELFVLNHRDFHSRNIMLRDGRPCIIDFQDARMGLPQYDLASLLRDSYLVLDAPLFERLMDRYYRSAREAGIHSMDRAEFDRLFDLSAFQRNVKAVGTFAYQSRVLGRRRYEPNIASTLSYLGGYASRRSELSRVFELLLECAGGRA
ncbi:MAG TPA: phosphotransferase [Spirochaetota bacterium]|nr:phosphotransferase [Spirochaetota bacterium]